MPEICAFCLVLREIFALGLVLRETAIDFARFHVPRVRARAVLLLLRLPRFRRIEHYGVASKRTITKGRSGLARAPPHAVRERQVVAVALLHGCERAMMISASASASGVARELATHTRWRLRCSRSRPPPSSPPPSSSISSPTAAGFAVAKAWPVASCSSRARRAASARSWRALCVEGATVALWDVRADALDEVFEWLTRTHKVAPSAVRRTVVDVADRRAVERAAAELAHACGAVRVLVNNAAIVCGDALLAGSSADSLERTLRVNIEGAFWVVRALAAPMLAAGGGTVVTVGSVVAQLPSARLADYCASKAALGMLHACLRWELRAAPRGDPVRCLLVQPYLLDTPLFAGGVGLFPHLSIRAAAAERGGGGAPRRARRADGTGAPRAAVSSGGFYARPRAAADRRRRRAAHARRRARRADARLPRARQRMGGDGRRPVPKTL